MRIFGKGFNFSQDGPGNRLVYHLSGCNMRCLWCSNPEGMDPMAGYDVDEDELISECVRSKPLFFGGGGVTFTGGEATLQAEALLRVLPRLKAQGIHTALETNGTSSQLPALSAYIDYLIMDFKHHDGTVLRQYTGTDNTAVCCNFEQLCADGRQLHVRIPLIHGVNDDAPEAFAAYFARYATPSAAFEFLPYHEYGKEKWTEPYQVTDGFVTPDTVARFARIFAQHGLRVVHT